ncbi:MAG: DUF835 domain-containing protein [Methanobacteriota archaeon]
MTELGKNKPHQMREGTCYLVKEGKPLLSFALFEMMLADGARGLCITRQYPQRLRERYKLGAARALWLSQTPGPESHNPTSIGALATVVSRYIEESHDSAIILDGIEYLVVNNGFAQVLKFVEHVNEMVMRSRAIMIIPVSPDAFDKREMALLERNMDVIESPLVQIGKPPAKKENVDELLDKY